MLFEVRIKLERGKRFFVVGVVTAARRLCREAKVDQGYVDWRSVDEAV